MTLLAALLASATVFQYWPSLSFGFNYDDYHFVRPYSRAEVVKSFHGNWDDSGIERRFYRPVTVAMFAARFAWLRYDERAYHAASVIALVACGVMVMAISYSVTNTLAVPLWLALLWAVHPNMPLSLGAWITNQMHLLQALVFACALAWWWFLARGRRAAIWWMPLLALGVLAFLIKEDGVLLLPAIVIIHELYRLIVDRDGRVPAMPSSVLLAIPVMLAALLAWRYYVLGGWGGVHSLPSETETIWANLAKGPAQVLFLRPALHTVTKIQAWMALAILPLGAMVAFARYRSIAFLWCVGVVLVLLFDLPFAFLTKREQFYLLSIGAVITFSASLAALTLAARAWFKPAIAAAGLVWIGAMHVSSRAAIDLFAPRNPATLATDAIVEEWAAVPVEIRSWIKAKREGQPVTQLSRDLPMIVHGAYGPEQDRGGRTYRWTSDRVRIFCGPGVTSVKFGVRPLMIERPRRPFTVTTRVDGRAARTLTLEEEREQPVEVAASPGSEVEILVDHTWSPGNSDTRALGVMLYDLAAARNGTPPPVAGNAAGAELAFAGT